MSSKRTHYIFAGIAFFVAFFTYFLTMQPSISFWDCGEFAAAAFGLQVGHPPGAPLWALVGRFAMMLPTFTDTVARYNLFSVIASALSILLLYLTTVRLIKLWRGEPRSVVDQLTTYGGGLIAALSYCFTDSFWFNALECEVYAFGSLFISIIPWLMLVWYDHADEEHSEKYLLLVSYVIGLSLGVHQLALLAVFPCFMLIYYKRRQETSIGSWLAMALSACVAFIIAFKLVLSELVELLGGGAIETAYGIIGAAIVVWIYNASTKASATKDKGYFGVSKRTYTQIGIAFLSRYVIGAIASGVIKPGPNPTISKLVGYLLIAGTIFGIVYSQREKKALLNLSLWSVFLLFMGYSTYYLYIVRAGQEPPMNQWHADNFATITKFINRDQYGYRPPWPRQVGDQERPHEEDPVFTNYSGNWDFFWKYQTNEMYNRYLMWNYVGRVSQADGAGVDWSKTLGIPLFLGLFGLYWHFKRDPKRALTILGAFILFGWATAWYQNQQDPQPRERDYFYVGAFYLYAMWIGIGATGIMEMMRVRKLKAGENEDEESMPVPTGDGNLALVGGTLLAAFVLVPLNQAIGLTDMIAGKSFEQSSKWREYSRSHNHVPLEYAYNVLQSCEKDAVLFTAGDNDTFPLWCAQDVYGIRRDIRIVNLSLGNMGWYIKQLLKDSWGVGRKLNLPGFDEKMLADPDDNELRNKHQFRDKSKIEHVQVSAATMQAFSGNPNAPAGVMTWHYRGELQQGQDDFFFLVADELVRSIIEGNINERPIYFAPFVQDQYLVGLRPFIQSEGMSQRVTPIMQSGGGPLGPIKEDVCAQSALNIIDKDHISLTPKRGYFLQTFSDPDARWSNEDRTNYPPFFSMQRTYFGLADNFAREGKIAEANKTLDMMDMKIPPERVVYDDRIVPLISQLYKRLGNEEKAKKYSKYALVELEKAYNETVGNATPSGRDINQAEQYAQALIASGDIEKAQTVLQRLLTVSPDKQSQGLISFRMEQVNAMLTEKKGDKKAALALYDQFFSRYGQAIANSGAEFAAEFGELHNHVEDLRKQLTVGDTLIKKDSSKKK
jgi:hypothetical protein